MSITKTDLVATAQQRLARAGGVRQLDMTSVLNVLEAALEIAEGLDELKMPVDQADEQGRRANSQMQAEAGRQLNRLGDLLDVAQAELRVEYWSLKGYSDPRA